MSIKNLVTTCLILATLIAVTACLLVPDAISVDPIVKTNLINNGDFEDIVETSFEHWIQSGDGGFNADSVIARGGEYSLAIVAGSDTVEPSVKQSVMLEPGRYKFTGYYRADSELSAQHARVQIMFVNNGEHFKIDDVANEDIIESVETGTRIGIYWDFLWIEPDPDLVEAGEWKCLEAVIDLRNYDGLAAWFELKLWRQAGTLWWDDISLVAVE